MSVKENLIAAKALIDTPDKWIKGYCQPVGRYSADTALYAACGNSDDFDDALDPLIEHMPFGERQVANFNDRPNTTHADIMSLFDRAIEASE